MTVIDEYLKKIDPARRAELERIRAIAKRVVPDAQEVISYGMPGLTYKGKAFFGFDVHSKHVGVYPYGGEEIEMFKEELAKHKYVFSKGAIRVPYDNPMPEELLRKIILKRIKRLKGQIK